MKKYRTRSVVGFVALLLALAGAYYLWLTALSPPAKIMKRVRSSLIDPDSARFRNVKVFSDGEVGCGFVNSKNRMGGYVGETTFVALPGRIEFEPPPVDEGASLERKVQQQQKVVAFLEVAVKNCPGW